MNTGEDLDATKRVRIGETGRACKDRRAKGRVRGLCIFAAGRFRAVHRASSIGSCSVWGAWISLLLDDVYLSLLTFVLCLSNILYFVVTVSFV